MAAIPRLQVRDSAAPAWRLILLPLAAAGGFCALRGLMDPWLGEEAPFLLLVLPVALAARLGGTAAGLVTTLVSALAADLLFVAPRGALVPARPELQLTALTFVAIGAFVSALGGRVRAALAVSQRSAAEQARVAAALRESEGRFRHLAEAMPQVVWTADPAGVVDYYNQRWADLTGLDRDEGLRGGWTQVVHPDDLQRTAAAWRRSVQTGAAYEVVHRIRAGDGTYRWFLSRALPSHDERGRVARWLGTATDIDDRVRAEEALREADRRKDEFLSMLAHELRNPLAPIRLALDLLEADDPARRRRAREVVARQTEHLTRIVDDLLEVSRITRGKIRLEPQDVDLCDVVNRAVDAVRHLTATRDQALEVRLPPAPLRLRADPVRLGQVLSNLLLNAAKYTPPGGHIEVAAERAGHEVIVRVKDDGVGIPRALLDRVFDLFVQADRTLDRSEGGLGIGLTLARRLVEMHGGQIHATSEGPGQGSEFVVRLPLLTAEPAAALAPAAPHDGEAHDGARRVLVVDDNADAADLLCDLLRQEGHQVRVARDGLSALAEVGSFHPDVLLLDIGLPGLDGYEVAARVRGQNDRAQPLLVAVTGYGQASDRRRSLEAGFDHHLVKPVDPTRLNAILRAAR
ncbi:MAG: ATP-binding protein [Planctomycetes bacterium]|nr:ATP-binding protein [Planctomycetota bacterium]